MKKFLKDYNFEDYFDLSILSRGKSYYKENRILDIWCQENTVTAYIDGSEIYRIELRINDKGLNNFYCSCPYSEDGEYMCKHIAAVLYYLDENEILELEVSNKKQEKQDKNKSELSKIYDEMNYELRKISDREEKFKLPGGTQGYITPEYYLSKNVTIDVARKQDYFALGSCLFYLKFGIPLLRYKKYEDTEMNADRIIDILLRNINYLKTQIFTDKDFIKFIIKLLNFKPEDRPTFQQIYRNKWVNKDIDILDKTIMAFENDEEKLI